MQLVSIDTFGGVALEESKSRIETEAEIEAYIAKMKYALDHNAEIQFQERRRVDDSRDERHTNAYTVRTLFSKEDPTEVLKRELRTLTVSNYMRTVKDIKYPKRSEMREFGKTYDGTEDVYIKVRIEMLDQNSFGKHTVFIMSFHFAVKAFKPEDFPYRKR